MGVDARVAVLDGKLTEREVRLRFSAMVEDDARETGTGPYAGNWTTVGTLVFASELDEGTFASRAAAEEFALGHSTRWENCIAARFRGTVTRTLRRPTFAGLPIETADIVAKIPMVDGRVAEGPREYAASRDVQVPADQLSEADQAAVRAAAEAGDEAALAALRERLLPILYDARTEQCERWLIAGWASI